MPFLLAACLIACVDRVNAGFASLQTNKAVGTDPKAYGLGGELLYRLPAGSAEQGRDAAVEAWMGRRRGAALKRGGENPGG